jgi:hypothetical protein
MAVMVIWFVRSTDQHMIVYAPGLFTHLLDIGLCHEPCCHIMMDSALPGVPLYTSHLVPLLQAGNTVTIDLSMLELVPLNITTGHLVNTFKNNPSLENRRAILHYFLVHKGEMEIVAEVRLILF